MVMSPVTQMLQPMHSRMSSMRPSSIFFGRKGSAIDGRAAPMKSRMPCFTWRTIMSGEVKRPTPTTGFGVSCLMPRIRSSCAPSGLKREVPEQALPGAMGEIPEIGKLGMHGDEVAQLRIGEARGTRHLVERQAHRDGAGVAHLVARVRDQLLQQARAVLQRAAIFVGALIGARREEMLDDAEAMRAIEAEDVVARPLGAAVGQLVPVAQVADVLLVHGAGLHRIAGEGEDRQVRRRQRHFARVEIGAVGAAIGQLDSGQRTVGMNGIGHLGEAGHVVLVPDAQFDEGRDLGRCDGSRPAR